MRESNTDYRESITYTALGNRKYIRHVDGKGCFAHLVLRLRPTPGRACCVSRAASLAIPDDFLSAAEAALQAAFRSGPLHGLRMWGVEAECIGGSFRERFATPEAYAAAAGMAWDDALPRACPVVVEPWVRARLRVENGAVAGVIDTLTEVLGTVDLRITHHPLVLDVRLPERKMEALRRSLGLRNPHWLPMPPEERWRPLAGELPRGTDRKPGWGDFT